MESAPEKEGEIARLSRCLVAEVKKIMAVKKKEPAEKSNDTAGQGADTNKGK
jgi:hypothetical protein